MLLAAHDGSSTSVFSARVDSFELSSDLLELPSGSLSLAVRPFFFLSPLLLRLFGDVRRMFSQLNFWTVTEAEGNCSKRLAPDELDSISKDLKAVVQCATRDDITDAPFAELCRRV